MLAIPTGAMWPKARVRAEVKDADADGNCGRCGETEETEFHRVWQCRCRVERTIYEGTDDLIAEARAQQHMHECYWTRGLIPRSWTALPPP
eukprot:832263-Pyramimonas_sp.AAC.1